VPAKTTVFPNLPIRPSSGECRIARVCIATYEILGPSKSGGIGTAYYSLATCLAAANHDVTILFLWAERSDESEIRFWQSHFQRLGITLVPLPAPLRMVDLPDCMLIARDAHAWLRKRQFDVIHFPELHGYGYYCVLAKHQGLDFERTTICIGTHSPISWIRELNYEAPYSPAELEMDFMERQCVALADVVVSPSQYMLGWMRSRGWVLPSACYVQQNIALPESGKAAHLADREGAVELVFFGTLEARKGIGLFCDALDLLQSRGVPGFGVTFLGKNGRISGCDGVSFIKARAQHWRFPCRLLTDYSHEAALRFLSGNGRRIAIIPSLDDNLPNTVLECLSGSIPFLASHVGGIPELIAPSDLERVTFAPAATELAARLVLAIRNGVQAAQPAIDTAENRQKWLNWHASLACSDDNERQAREGGRPVTTAVPITVCLNYRGGYESLCLSLESLRRQTYPSLEVVLLDYSTDGSENDLRSLTRDFDSNGWRLVRADPRGSTARNDAAAEARGEYVLLMEASDYLNTEAVATFIRVANHTGADVLTCFLALFQGMGEPLTDNSMDNYPFLGGAVLSGMFRNHFGLRVIFVKRDNLLRLGNFHGNARRDCADWEFLARAALMNCRMEVIPVPLAYYRISNQSGPDVPVDYLDQAQALAPYAQAMPPALRDLPKAALTMGLLCQMMYKRFGEDAARVVLQRQWANRNTSRGDSVAGHEGAMLLTINQMPRGVRKKMASILDGWLEYSAARAQLPPFGLHRISHIARLLMRGHYHRYAHGFGSALRDLRKPSPPRWQAGRPWLS
jgi:O-antigen biosynthesis protein